MQYLPPHRQLFGALRLARANPVQHSGERLARSPQQRGVPHPSSHKCTRRASGWAPDATRCRVAAVRSVAFHDEADGRGAEASSSALDGWPAFPRCPLGRGLIRVPRFAVDMMRAAAVRVSVIPSSAGPGLIARWMASGRSSGGVWGVSESAMWIRPSTRCAVLRRRSAPVRCRRATCAGLPSFHGTPATHSAARREIPGHAGYRRPNRRTVKAPEVLRTPALTRVSFPAIA